MRVIGNPRNLRTCGREDDPSLPSRAFQPGKNRKCASRWQINQDVEALGHRDREAAACDRVYWVAVGRDHAANELAEIDPELAGGGAIEPRLPSPFWRAAW